MEETEHEKCCLKTELLKSQKELATLRPQKVEGLYWGKNHMGYCQAELQELKAKLARSTEEKAELMERLKDTEMHLEALKEAQVSCRGPEKDDVKRSEQWAGCLAVPIIPNVGGEGRSNHGLPFPWGTAALILITLCR